jgi:hypothetical protein
MKEKTTKKQVKGLRRVWCCQVCGETRGLTFLHAAGGKVAVCKEHNPNK